MSPPGQFVCYWCVPDNWAESGELNARAERVMRAIYDGWNDEMEAMPDDEGSHYRLDSLTCATPTPEEMEDRPWAKSVCYDVDETGRYAKVEPDTWWQ